MCEKNQIAILDTNYLKKKKQTKCKAGYNFFLRKKQIYKFITNKGSNLHNKICSPNLQNIYQINTQNETICLD